MTWTENTNHHYIGNDETLRINKEFMYSLIQQIFIDSCNMQGPTVTAELHESKEQDSQDALSQGAHIKSWEDRKQSNTYEAN